MITFAAFHIDIGKEDLAGINQIIATVTVKEEPRLYLEMALASCRARHPGGAGQPHSGQPGNCTETPQARKSHT